jgi:hypothetical protein
MPSEARASVEELLVRVRTIGDANDAITELFNIQMDRADNENVAPNEAVEGDSFARDAFLTVLPVPDQRAFFLSMIRNRRFLPRIRTLVGSPPFTFLNQEDDTVVRAAGITRGRSHMATVDGDISSYTSFGSAQYVDGTTRDFKVIGKHSGGRGAASDVHTPARRQQYLPFVDLNSGDVVVLEVRLKKRSLQKKIEIAQGKGDVDRAAVAFPRVGAVINLQPTKRLRAITSDLNVHVRSVQPRAVSSNVARLLCSVT